MVIKSHKPQLWKGDPVFLMKYDMLNCPEKLKRIYVRWLQKMHLYTYVLIKRNLTG